VCLTVLGSLLGCEATWRTLQRAGVGFSPRGVVSPAPFGELKLAAAR